DNGADVINLSLGSPLPSRVIADAISYAHEQGVVVIAAAGNSSTSLPAYPAAFEHVIAVSATRYDRQTTFYSNYGDYIDIAAPGGDTRVDQNGDGRPDGVLQETMTQDNPAEHDFALYMGTSMAAPHVAGVAALIMANGVTHPDRVEEALLSTAVSDFDGFDQRRYGSGILSASDSAQYAGRHFQFPRVALTVLLALGALALARRSGGLSEFSHRAMVVFATFVATGVSALTVLLGWFGLGFAWLSPFGSSPLLWPRMLGLSWFVENPLWLSALPALSLYALLGSTKRAAWRAGLVALFVGIAGLLLGEAIAPTADVAWIPGAGALDRVWLLCNAAVAFMLGSVSARKA
ncbi:MAG: S8 family serine peptidase, partial [Myxococcales bacterium]|nr:S8 family serine peptidase [Myxococcales bacterium]